MPVQTTYSLSPAAAFAGLLFDTHGNKLLTAAIQSETTEEIPFGTFVARGSTTDALLKPKALRLASGADHIFGAVAHSHAYNRETDLGTVGLKPKTQMTIVEGGCLWMLAEQDLVQTDLVYARYATGVGGSIRGILRKDADTASAMRVKGARLLGPSQSVTILGVTYKVVPVEFSVLVQEATA